MFGMGNRRPPPPAPTDEHRAPAARKAALVSVTVRLTPAQREKLERLGGDAWLREQIEAATPDLQAG